MSSSDEELATWLRAAITARLELARKATPGPWEFEGDDEVFTVHDGEHGDLVGHTVAFTRHWADANGEHIAANDPRDTIARCEAELAILDLHQPVAALGDLPADALTCIRNWEECQECGPNNDRPAILAAPGPGETFWPCKTVRLLAGGYRHQPGYRKEWAPDRA